MISKNHLDQITNLLKTGRISEEIQAELFQLADAVNEDDAGEETAFRLRIMLEVYENNPAGTFGDDDGDHDVFEEETVHQFSLADQEKIDAMQDKIDEMTGLLEEDENERADRVVAELQPHLIPIK